MTWNNTENTWDERRPTLNRWWDRLAENKNDEMSNKMSTSPVAQQAAKQWLERLTQSKTVIDDKRKLQSTSIIMPPENGLDLSKCRRTIPIACRLPCESLAMSVAMVRASVHSLADEVCCAHDRWEAGPLANNQRLYCMFTALIRRLRRLVADLDHLDDGCCDRLATLIEQYHGCRDKYRKLCAYLRGR